MLLAAAEARRCARRRPWADMTPMIAASANQLPSGADHLIGSTTSSPSPVPENWGQRSTSVAPTTRLRSNHPGAGTPSSANYAETGDDVRLNGRSGSSYRKGVPLDHLG